MEVMASRHKDDNSVACIVDKCYVLSYPEYCRYFIFSLVSLCYKKSLDMFSRAFLLNV